MSVKLDDVELIKKVEDPDAPFRELRTVYDIKVNDKRNVVELRVPGSSGNVIQDMGCEPVSISIVGEVLGQEAKQSLENLRNKYERAESLQFSSDITDIPEVSKVVIEDYYVEEVAGTAGRFRYYLLLKEYREPREPPEEKVPEQEGEEAEKESGNPANNVTVKIKGPDGEKQVKTDEQGYYELLEVPEGKYEITVDAPGYEDEKREFEIKKGAKAS
jgi:hypothetical protein